MADPTLTDDDPAPAADDGVASRRLVARVLAWQHRHPLARRLSQAEVTGLGVIALPYAEGGGAAAKALYHQPGLLPGLSHRRLVEFAGRHAVAGRPGAPGWPQRDVERADAAPEPAPQTRYLLTAAVPGRRGQPSRLLLAPAGTAVWGRRPLDRVRVGAAAAAGLALLVLAAWGLAAALHRGAAAPAAAAASAPASAPSSAAAPAPAAASAPARVPSSPAAPASGATAAASAHPAPTAPAPVSAAAASAAAPPASGVHAAVAARPAARPPAAAPTASTPAPAASLPAPRLLPMPSRASMAASAAEQAPHAAPAPPAASAASGPHYALVSVPTRQRAAADATLQRVRQLLGPAIGNLQAQVMTSPQGFVVTVWPLPTQADAERLADVLARRGVLMKWMEF